MVVNTTTINIRTASDHCTARISAETTDEGDDEGENDGVGNGKHYEFDELSTAGYSSSQVVGRSLEHRQEWLQGHHLCRGQILSIV